MAKASDAEARVERALSAVYQCVTEPAGWQAAIAALGDAIGSPRAALFRVSADGSILDMFQCGHDPDAQRAYVDYYHALDPIVPAGQRTRVGQWGVYSELLRPGTGLSREYVDDFCRPFDLRHLGGARVFDLEGSQAILSFQRGYRDAPFGAQQKAAFERLAPHIVQVLNLQAELRKQASAAALAHSALEQFRCAAFVVDAGGRILLRNRAADQLLTIPGAFTAGGEVLRLPVAGRLANRLTIAITQACSTMLRGDAFALPRPDGLAWQVRVLPLDGATRGLARERAALVLVSRPEDASPDASTLAALFDLTPTESDLLTGFAFGGGIDEIAARRGVSVATIRTQIRSIYQKTGARNQRELAALTRTLPSR